MLDARFACHYEPWQRSFNDLRILHDITLPRFEIQYIRLVGRNVIASGEERVSDMNYFWSPLAQNLRERFAYEKDIPLDWFRKRFVELGYRVVERCDAYAVGSDGRTW